MLKHSRVFEAKLLVFRDIIAFVEGFCEAASLSRADRHKLTLVVEELFSNTVRHGHGGDSDAPVEISLEFSGTRTTLTYQDCAPRYDVLEAGLRSDIESTINQRRVGGLGVALIVALAEAAQYSFVDDRNRLVISLPASAD